MNRALKTPINIVVALSLCIAWEATATSATILRTDRVWNVAAHNAFTDLVWHKDRFVLAFREGSQHGVPPVSQPGGYLRILTSPDGLLWMSAAQIQGTSNEDLRDAKLSITPAGKLMLTGAAAFKNATSDRQSMAWFSDNGTNWSSRTNIGESNRWLWGTAWNHGYVYGVGYGPTPLPTDQRTTRLYRSTDGLNFQTYISSFTGNSGFNGGGETALLFRSNGLAVALSRRDTGDFASLIGTSSGDFSQWSWQSTGLRIGGPELIELPDGRIVAATRRHDGGERTSLQWLDPVGGTLTEFLVLPSGGDSSYAGMVWHDDLLWVSYYSSHQGKASIYVSQVDIPLNIAEPNPLSLLGVGMIAIIISQYCGRLCPKLFGSLRYVSSSTRAIAVIAAFAALIALAGARQAAAEAPSDVAASSSESMKVWRKSAADRRRRIIFNNDGAEPVMQMTKPTAKEFLDLRTTGLLGSHVDSIFYCPRCSGFGMFTYFTKVGEVFTTREGRYQNNQMEALLREGVDPLRVMVDFCKENELEMFCSFRMNDNHDGTTADYAPLIFRANKFKNAHPELLLGTINKRPKIGAWASVDYGRTEIRDLAFRFAEEVCNNYDIDGIELDFFRHPVFFKSTSRGEVSTDEDRAAMTDLLARIRNHADRTGKSRGRPILIAVRVPDSVDYCHAIGLDLERWLKDDLLDLYIAAGTFQLNDWDYSVALARKYGVKVYPSLDDSRGKDPAGIARRMTQLSYRGRAANVWASGADGVYLYNFFDHSDSKALSLREMGSAEILARLDKDYLPAARGVVRSSGGCLPYQKFQNAETLNPANPKTIEPGKSTSAHLVVGETVDSDSAAGVKLRLLFRKSVDAEDAEVKFNGRRLVMTRSDNHWLEGRLSVADLRRGANMVAVQISEKAGSPAEWLDLALEVRHTNTN
jgi:hypothetical protein